jgi:CRISPR-associated protein Cmr1
MGINISRYLKRTQIEFEIEVITPMFLHGADTACAELRVPSLKGILRFWWRATSGIEEIRKLKEEEGKLFGDTSSKATTIIRIEHTGKITVNKDFKQRGATFKVHNRPVFILDYLAYGMHTNVKGKKNNVDQKEHIPPGSCFKLLIECEEKNADQVLRALAWMICYGGIGARNRNGFGSVFTKIAKPEVSNASEPANFSALSNHSQLFSFSKLKTWHEAHSEIGLAYHQARLSIENLHQYDRRKLISAPIMVKNRNVADLERHAKPYFLHVNKLESGAHQGQIFFMPYKYLSARKDFTESKLKEYEIACAKMNETLKSLSGGAA